MELNKDELQTLISLMKENIKRWEDAKSKGLSFWDRIFDKSGGESADYHNSHKLEIDYRYGILGILIKLEHEAREE